MAQAMVEFIGEPATMSNEAICEEKVWNNFWKGKYSVFDVLIHKPSGYINATQISKGHNTQFGDWFRLKNVKKQIADIAAGITERGHDAVTEHDMVITVHGGKDPERLQVRGTYVHPLLFAQLLSWIEPMFASGMSIMANIHFGLCSAVSRASILDLLNTDNVPAATDAPAAAAAAAAAAPQVKPAKPKVLEDGMFAIYKRNDDKFPYQAFDGTVRNVKSAIKRFQKLPVAGEVLYSVMGLAPGVKLYGLIKSAGLVKTNKNAFNSPYSQQDLLDKINVLSWKNVTANDWCQSVREVLNNDMNLSGVSDVSDSEPNGLDETD